MSGQRKVAYLIGAGATHGCIKALASPRGILMDDLGPPLAERVRELVLNEEEFGSLRDVVNEVVTNTPAIEHLITFFDESPASLHRRFADELRRIFETVLKSELMNIEAELGPDRVGLYAALLDMYNVEGFEEDLSGILTLNYDDYIESAARQMNGTADEMEVGPVGRLGGDNGPLLLKLHGSFGWEDAWPIARRQIASRTSPLWIPPGIRKAKERYPFNLVWGLAHDVLDCDVVRVIGCRLGSSDWDLISLLFGTRHANSDRDTPYTIEIIDSPWRAEALKRDYPYLDVKSIFEIETLDVGRNLVSDFAGGSSRRFDSLTKEDQKALIDRFQESEVNWFRTWLVKMGQGLHYELGDEVTKTPQGALQRWLEI